MTCVLFLTLIDCHHNSYESFTVASCVMLLSPFLSWFRMSHMSEATVSIFLHYFQRERGGNQYLKGAR